MAYPLNTTVVSELRKGGKVDAVVRAWYETARRTKPYLSVIVLGEIRSGVERLRGRDPARALSLEGWLRELTRDYAEKILPVTLKSPTSGEVCARTSGCRFPTACWPPPRWHIT